MKRYAAFACALLVLAGGAFARQSGRRVPGQPIRRLNLVSAAFQAMAAAQEKAVNERIAQSRPTRPSKDALTPANLMDLHRLIRLQDGEYKWDAIPWYTSIWHARRAAAAQDRPILIFGTGGAGFNDPLGNC